ncbi:MAG TPA: DUF58 domain-containing protein [Vicinamibacterales bacterium]|nr:DUF58 domain-containing protein [Vicinamibacterales bacterium]
MSDSALLSSSAVAAIDDLELAARLVVEGVRSGAHRSPFHGFTAEFSQHRPYRPGDDLKYLDWKVLARTDRLYSRQFSETTNLSVMLVLDASASMSFPAETGAPSKFRYSAIVTAALAYLIIDQGDAAGLMTMAAGRFVYLPAKGGRQQLRALLAMLSRLEPSGEWPIDRALTRGAELLKRRGAVIAVSDFYDATETTARDLRRIARGGHDVALLQVLSRDEITFPYTGDLEFEDLESGTRRHLDARAAGHAYRARVASFLEDFRKQVHRDGHDYALMPTDIPPSRALRSYLLRRAAAASSTARPGDAS